MKTLFLLRHAKSSWDSPTLDDFERPLNRRGTDNAATMAIRMDKITLLPETIYCSTATRARQTVEIMRQGSTLQNSNLVLEEDIYMADSRLLLILISNLDDSIQRVMLVGHNPGFTNLLNTLQAETIDNMPTCSVAILELNIDIWSQIGPDLGHLAHYDYPKKPH